MSKVKKYLNINTLAAKDPSYFNQDNLAATNLAVRVAIEQKGIDVRALDLRNYSDISDFFVIISGTSERHVKGIADKIRFALKQTNEAPISVVGYENSEWILLDYGYLVVHIFYEASRQYYEFDELWKGATLLDLDPSLELEAKRLRTGIFHR